MKHNKYGQLITGPTAAGEGSGREEISKETRMMSPLYYLISVMTITLVLTEAAKVPRSGNRPAVACTQASECGLSGCCLKGFCSRTGKVFDKCYAKIRENSRERPSGIWTQTDVCPCAYTYYCYSTSNSTQDPLHGAIGSCFPIMG